MSLCLILRKSLGTDSQTVQWIIIFYVGSSTGLQLSLGNAADRFGLKRFYLIGLAVYTLAVLLIGLAPALGMVFALRVLQAVGNGLIMVAVPALVTAIFPAATRGRALGLMTGIATLGMVTGAVGRWCAGGSVRLAGDFSGPRALLSHHVWPGNACAL